VLVVCCAGADSTLASGEVCEEADDAEAEELLPDAGRALADCPRGLDGALLAGRSEELELAFELPARLLALARAPEPVVAAPLDLPENACAATSARTPVSARLAAISQRLARPKRRRAASRVWVVCWRIALKRRRAPVRREARRQRMPVCGRELSVR
jgi:hypothetical protein